LLAARDRAGAGRSSDRFPRIALFHPAIPATLLTENRRRQRMARVFFFGVAPPRLHRRTKIIVIERSSAEGHHERYADMAREIVVRNPDMIVTGDQSRRVRLPRPQTSSIPIVAFMLDPLKAGLVTSLARPGGKSHRHHAGCRDRNLGQTSGAC